MPEPLAGRSPTLDRPRLGACPRAGRARDRGDGGLPARRAAAGRDYLPADRNMLRAFSYPLDDVRVLIVGQDPYPTPGHAVGLSFSVDRQVRPVPRSLQNIYRELHDDLGIAIPDHGDLGAWARTGVMLLNRVLTVQSGLHRVASGQGMGGRHRGSPIRALVAETAPARGDPVGAGCREPRARCSGSSPTIVRAHPSPLSAPQRVLRIPTVQSRERTARASRVPAPIDWSIA